MAKHEYTPASPPDVTPVTLTGDPASITPTRRGLFGRFAAGAAIAAAATHAQAAPNPDAELVNLCTRHIGTCATLAALSVNPDGIDLFDRPEWTAWCETHDLISEARATTMDGILAKARAAAYEAKTPGTEKSDWADGVPARWATDITQDLLRLMEGVV